MGAAIWTGGAVSLGVFTAALHRAEREGVGAGARALLRRAARAMALLMWPALGVTLVTGAANLALFLPSGGVSASAPYFPWLVAKLATVAVIVVSSGLHTFVIGPRIRLLETSPGPDPGVPAETVGLRRLNLALGMVSTLASVVAILLGAVLASF